ncbi:hypothetical protein D3C80_1743370 [compost metagenome]
MPVAGAVAMPRTDNVGKHNLGDPPVEQLRQAVQQRLARPRHIEKIQRNQSGLEHYQHLENSRLLDDQGCLAV